MRKNKINIGIIGLGYLGKYHYEKYHKNPLCNIEWVVDINKKNLNYVSPQYKKTWYPKFPSICVQPSPVFW